MAARTASASAALAVLGAMLVIPGLAAEQRASGRGTVTRAITDAACASDLGVGIKSRRRFCDLIIASTPRESVQITIPPRTGVATLLFDLHNRFTVPPLGADPSQAFIRNTAVIAVIRPTGEVIDRAAISREYRTVADVFDRIAGPGRGSPPRIVAPGHAQAIRIDIPAGLTSVGIVGTRLEEWRVSGRGTFDNPNKPIAMVSNLRLEFRPR